MSYSSDLLIRVRVCEAAQEHYTLRFDDGSECDAVPAGVLRWNAELPAVGDWVGARRVDATLALIESVAPRTTCISRRRPGGGGEQVLAANVDQIVIVMGLDGDYNLRRLERYLILAVASGAAVMVALNKMDVCPEWPVRLAEIQGLTSHTVALSAPESVAPIAEAVRGHTAVLLGSSGAGKSTIANALLGESRQATTRARVRLPRPPHDDPAHAHRTAGRRRPD
jgi:ribosome biogenesis GTPase / thiamine phosphate phosphatase